MRPRLCSATSEHDVAMLEPPELLDSGQINDLLARAGIVGPARASLLKRHNHVYRIKTPTDTLFLKCYTKDWYGGEFANTDGCVEHETAAWKVLAAHGVAVPEVVLDLRDCDHALGRPVVVTRQLRGTALTDLLYAADDTLWNAVLEATGDYLRQVHAITFDRPGYIMDGGPDTFDGSWQHFLWSAAQTQCTALATLEADTPRLEPALVQELRSVLETTERVLAPAWQPPRFTHGDCHAGQFFLYVEDGRWQVSGFVDLEVASAGDCVADLLKIGIELAMTFGTSRAWWEPLFAGYGTEPDLDLIRLRLLGWHEINWSCHRPFPAHATRCYVLTRLLQARTWTELWGAVQ